jgi:futalosine hydrolase
LRILVISATSTENRFATGLDIKGGIPVKAKGSLNHDVDVLVTGIGAVPTAFALTRCVQQYDLVVNIGIAGSYKSDIPVGSVVCVKEDAFGDYGVDDRGAFRSLSEMRLTADVMPSQDEILVNPWINFEFPKFKVPLVKGLTLSTASGSKDRIDQINKRWHADIETMESASVFYVCKLMGIRFIGFRAISNMVEPRDKSKWEMAKAINNLDAEVRNFINSL